VLLVSTTNSFLRRIAEHRRAVLVIAGCALGALLLTTAALTTQALAADRSARASTAKSLTQLATVAAWETSRRLAADIDAAGRMVTAPAARLNGRMIGVAAAAPNAEQLFATSTAPCKCSSLEVIGYVESRPDTTDLAVRLSGNGWQSGDSARVNALVRTVVAERLRTLDSTAATDRHEGLELHAMEERPGRSRLLFTQPVHTEAGRLAALYGVLVSSSSADSFFVASVRRASPLPESIIEQIASDSLLQISVLAPDSTVVFRTLAAAPQSEHAGRNPIGGVAAGIDVEARLLSPAVSIIAGLVPRRATAPILLFVVTGLLTVAVGWALLRHARLDAMRAEFMAGVAHEFHTPLALISAYAETSANGRSKDDSERARFMALIVRESQRLSHLVDNVQRVASTTRGPEAGSLQIISLTSTVADACASFALLAASTGTTLISNFEANVDVRGEAAGIRTALFNVLDNALKYGGAGRTIRVSIVPDEADVHVIVDDEGPGIARKDRARAFDRYVRLTSALGPEAAAGSGIGLSIVRDVLTAHGGRVEIESAPAGGARVRLTWPTIDR
jgi:signal transduction histidine kinase